MISRVATRMALGMVAKVLARQSVSSAIIRSMRSDGVIGSLPWTGRRDSASMHSALTDLFEVVKEPRPADLGAATGLLLIRPEACPLHAQMAARACRRERPCDHPLETIVAPRVGERLVRPAAVTRHSTAPQSSNT